MFDSTNPKAAKNTLIENYKNGTNFDTTSSWYRGGPKKADDFAFILFDPKERELAFTAYLVLTQLKAWGALMNQRTGTTLTLFPTSSIDRVYNHPAFIADADTSVTKNATMDVIKRMAPFGSFEGYKQYSKTLLPLAIHADTGAEPKNTSVPKVI